MHEQPWRVLIGDVFARLADLPDGAFQTCCTSPPYWALRSYLPAGHPDKHLELGQERSPDCFAWARGVSRCGACYVCRMTDVFAAVRRVLRDDGTLWVNVAGSYAAGKSGRADYRSGDPTSTLTSGARKDGVHYGEPIQRTPPPGWKAKDYVNVPALLAESLRADGWFLRAEIALTKVAPMPESCRDRPTRATEKLYLFAKRGAYFYDGEAEKSGLVDPQKGRGLSAYGNADSQDGGGGVASGNFGADAGGKVRRADPSGSRNLWDWWDSSDDDLPPAVWPWRPSGGRKSGHYATYPLWLPLRCVRLGTSARGACPACGAPWRRVVERTTMKVERSGRAEALGEYGRTCVSGTMTEPPASRTLGWSPSCKCPPADPVPCAVLDPFCGLATTGVAARLLGRSFVGIELSEPYAAVARGRLASACPLDDAAFRAPAPPPLPAQAALFAQED